MRRGLSATLHDGPRRLPWTSLPRLGLAMAALVANGAMASAQVSLALLAAATVLILIDGVPLARAWPFALALLSGVACVVAGWLAGMADADLARLGARLAAGLAWIAWAGITCRWPELRRGLQRVHLDDAAQTLEAAVVHGELLLGELQRGREAVLLRHGGRSLRPKTIGILLAGAIERAFARTKALDDARALRAGVPGTRGEHPVLGLERLCIDGCCGPARLSNVSLSVGRGEWVALAGPSGSGKTTLLKAAAGLVTPSSGRLLRFGSPVDGKGVSRRVDGRVALVFQDPHDQILGATPVEDVAWGLRQRGTEHADAEARARATLNSIGIGHLADRPIHELSFGERKRVAFAAALACQPTLLLCDEPTMGLDPVAATNLVRALETAAAPGMTVVWATHDLLALPAPTARLVLIQSGSIIFDGASSEGMSIDRLRRAGLAP
jgi:energy-coupling factor transporter ATP-binding protein EcfA2